MVEEFEVGIFQEIGRVGSDMGVAILVLVELIKVEDM